MIGDAAGQAKPTSGGGVFTGGVAAKCAADAVEKFLLDGEPLERYEEKWRSRIGRELRFGMRVHRALCRATDADLERLLDLVDSTKETVRRHGDIDHPSDLARALAREPSAAISMAALYLKTLINPALETVSPRQ